MTVKQALKLKAEKSYIRFAGGKYRVASVFTEFGVTWIEIYDEPPSLHIDRLKASSCDFIEMKGGEK